MSDATIAAWGRLGQDPKAVETKTGKAMTVTSMAVSLGEEQTFWLGLVAFGVAAEALLKHAKSDCLSVSGRLQKRSWTDREGKAREDLQLVVESLISARTVRPGRKSAKSNGASKAPSPAVPFDDPLPF